MAPEHWGKMDLKANNMHPMRPQRQVFRLLRWLALSLALSLMLLWPSPLFAQSPAPAPQSDLANLSFLPPYWFLLTAAIAMLVPAGFVLMSVAGLEPEHAWDAALGGMAALGLSAFGYWAVGFALQFGGVGLVYPQAGLEAMVWEWSPFSAEWGAGWGVAGLAGWFLSGEMTPLVYALFLAHIPWAMTTALIPVVALRGRAPATATLILAFCLGTFVYPLAGNWVRGGGWLGALGNNLLLGHGFVDFGGAGTVHLVAAGFALAALVVWVPRRQRRSLQAQSLITGRLPLLAVVGSLFVLGGSIGWLWSNPLQMSTLDEMALMRGSVNCILFAAGGMLVPLAYTWFVTGRSEPLMSTRGMAAGVVAGLAVGPFVSPGIAFFIGLLAGATVPFVTYLVDGLLNLDDATGAVTVSGLPAMVGLLLLGLFADGSTGQGWQMTGMDSYLGVSGQGVSGLFTARGYQMDFPGQMQAQVIGVVALGLWGFLAGMALSIPLGLLLHGLLRSSGMTAEPPLMSGEPSIAPVSQTTAGSTGRLIKK